MCGWRDCLHQGCILLPAPFLHRQGQGPWEAEPGLEGPVSVEPLQLCVSYTSRPPPWFVVGIQVTLSFSTPFFVPLCSNSRCILSSKLHLGLQDWVQGPGLGP